eukprot:TRINITY_DN8587_c0_g1_i1.p1 TRINITY_DN8587_c0_g1~~TRINITY_DN8587_c0_g1_i1.p1  ORF type:complete len:120 (+),score=14.80 TRINITY_DN8587_c0_g1_i1:151-510(+)
MRLSSTSSGSENNMSQVVDRDEDEPHVSVELRSSHKVSHPIDKQMMPTSRAVGRWKGGTPPLQLQPPSAEGTQLTRGCVNIMLNVVFRRDACVRMSRCCVVVLLCCCVVVLLFGSIKQR